MRHLLHICICRLLLSPWFSWHINPKSTMLKTAGHCTQRKPQPVISLGDASRINSPEDGTQGDLSVKWEFSPPSQIEEVYLFLRDLIPSAPAQKLIASRDWKIFSRMFIPLASTMWFSAFFFSSSARTEAWEGQGTGFDVPNMQILIEYRWV